MPTTDYYEVLGVARDASGDEIKRAYRTLARSIIPTFRHDKSDAEIAVQDDQRSLRSALRSGKRAQYDRFRRRRPTARRGASDFGFGAGAFGDIFDMFFGNVRRLRKRGTPGRSADPILRYDLEITLEEAFAGTTKEIHFNHLAQCDACTGIGRAPRNAGDALRALQRQRHRCAAFDKRRSDSSSRRPPARVAAAKVTSSSILRGLRRPRKPRDRTAADREGSGRRRRRLADPHRRQRRSRHSRRPAGRSLRLRERHAAPALQARRARYVRRRAGELSASRIGRRP